MVDSWCAYTIHAQEGCSLMGKTHITVGTAAALALVQPHTPASCLLALCGGAVGGILCDVECRNSGKKSDTELTLLITLALIVLTLILDTTLNLGICHTLLTERASRASMGLVILILCCVKGRFSPHRDFTHSFLFAGILTFACFQIHPVFGLSVACGCLSHLCLDLTNRKPLRLFYPLRHGFCLRLFYADRLANRILMWLGLLGDAVLLAWCLAPFIAQG